MRHPSSGRLAVSCDECFWTCDDPDKADRLEAGYEGYQLDFEWPSWDEIERSGWARYCTQREET